MCTLQVGVPLHVAKQLSFPERVTEHNIARLRQNVLNGAHSTCWHGRYHHPQSF